MDLETWKKAANIAAEAREFGKSLIRPGANFLEVSRKIEEFIEKKGARPGFPVQLSVNSLAAHYTAHPEDTSVFKEGDLVKLDLGAHIEGYIGDTAFPSILRIDKFTFIIANYSSPIDLCKDWSWIKG